MAGSTALKYFVEDKRSRNSFIAELQIAAVQRTCSMDLDTFWRKQKNWTNVQLKRPLASRAMLLLLIFSSTFT